MTIVDIIILLVVALSCLFGAMSGLVRAALSLAAWVLAAVFGTLFSEDASVYLESLVANPSLRRVIAFVLIFIVTVFAGGILGNLIAKLASAAGLGGVDRGLGALFGIIRGVVMVTLVIVLMLRFDVAGELFNQSVLVPHALALADYIENLLGLPPAGAGASSV